MHSFLAAIRFLTIIPIPGQWGTKDIDLATSLPYFPLVGLLLGGLAMFFLKLILLIFPQVVGAVLLVTFLLAVSGGLHIDGLCDTADGLFSSRPRERMMEIMRDSRVGAMGLVAVLIILSLKTVCLAVIPMQKISYAALLMPMAGRCVLVLQMAVLPYARPEGGLASLFYGRRPVISALWSLILFFGVAWMVLGPAGLIVFGGVLTAVLLYSGYCFWKIGGATGDTLGAGCEIAETIVGLVFAAGVMNNLFS